MWFLKHFHKFWKFISKTLLNSTGQKCYAHPTPSPRISVERQTGGPQDQRGPTRQPVPSRDGADRRDLADGEVSGQAKMTGVTPHSREPNGAHGVTQRAREASHRRAWQGGGAGRRRWGVPGHGRVNEGAHEQQGHGGVLMREKWGREMERRG
jgi:hypothetical protein